MAAIRRHFVYVPVLVGATALMFLKNIVYARIFSVENFGGFNQALLCAGVFTNFAGAGLQLLGHKLLPQYYARGDHPSAERLLASALGVYGLAAALVAGAIGVGIFSGLLRDATASYATLLNASAQSVFLLCLIQIKSEFRFLDHALLSTLRAVLLLAGGAAVAVITRDVGATLATEGMLTLVVATPLFAGSRGRQILGKAREPRAEYSWLALNLPGALRLLWLNGTVTLLYTIDRWTGLALLTKREYGIFSLGLLVIAMFETMQTVVNVAAYPLMGRMIAHEEHARAFRFATLATLVVVGVTAICYVPFVLLLDFMVRAYLPQYVDAVTVLKLAVVAGALRLADFYGSFAVLCDKEQKLAWAFGAVVAVAAALIVTARAAGDLRLNPNRLAVLTVLVSACGFLLNLAGALHGRRRCRVLVSG
jgi:O-antigen/teichoic acid export membrane protein